MSEKYSGIRCIWNGNEFYGRNGNKIDSPNWFKEKIPSNIILDGELW